MDAESTRTSDDGGGDGIDGPVGGTSDPTAEDRRPNRRMRAATVLCVPALLAFVASAVLFLVPVTNAEVQHCGPPAGFLLGATTDAPLIRQDGTAIHDWKTPRLRQAHEHRCSVQVADRAVPAGILLVVFWMLTLVAIVLGWTGRRALRSRSE